MNVNLSQSDPALDSSTITDWSVAKKVKPIRAKALVNVLIDQSVLNKLLLTTLEGQQSLGDGSMICVGEAGDIWQQMSKKLLAKYDVTAVDKDGWMVCEPRPDNAVECCQITGTINTLTGEHYLKALWGEEIPNLGKNLQAFVVGDYICRNRQEKTDVWVVRRKFFENTYTIIGG
jgi:hypothetical protein